MAGLLSTLFGNKPLKENEIEFPQSLGILNWEKVAHYAAKKASENEYKNWSYEYAYKLYSKEWSDLKRQFIEQRIYYEFALYDGERRRNISYVPRKDSTGIYCVWPVDISGPSMVRSLDEREMHVYKEAVERFKKLTSPEIHQYLTVKNLFLGNFVLYYHIVCPYKEKADYLLNAVKKSSRDQNIIRIKTSSGFPDTYMISMSDLCVRGRF